MEKAPPELSPRMSCNLVDISRLLHGGEALALRRRKKENGHSLCLVHDPFKSIPLQPHPDQSCVFHVSHI